MEAGRMSFQLAAYPVPGQFVFVHLGNQTSSMGTDVSHRFSAECHQDPVTEYIVHCEVILLAAPQDVTGLYRAEVYNDLGKVDFFFNIQQEKQTADDGKDVYGAVGGLLIIFIIVVAAVVLWRKRDQIFKTTRSATNRISGLYAEIEELPLTMRYQPHPLHGPVQQRPLPQPPSAALTVSCTAHQESQQDPLQARSLPKLSSGCGGDTSSSASLVSVQTHKAVDDDSSDAEDPYNKLLHERGPCDDPTYSHTRVNADGLSGAGDDYNELTQGRQPTCQDTTYSHTSTLV
ncbi:uncharacterized protein [Littorina saxatilis]|uniref:uncharacterized protein n=1 Tax=Littorina saxatilis TaxID=31220 RepID=UPI0038B57EA8